MQEFQNTRNPILPLEHHIPDSEGHVMPDGKLYIYGSYDDREDVYCSEKYHVVSTPDMEHWTIHDISLTGQKYHGLIIQTHPSIRGLIGPSPRLLSVKCWSPPHPVVRT